MIKAKDRVRKWDIGKGMAFILFLLTFFILFCSKGTAQSDNPAANSPGASLDSSSSLGDSTDSGSDSEGGETSPGEQEPYTYSGTCQDAEKTHETPDGRKKGCWPCNPHCGDGRVSEEAEARRSAAHVVDGGQPCNFTVVGQYGPEDCDPLAQPDGCPQDQQCTANCFCGKCGDGIVQPSIGEQCEPDIDPVNCDADCRFACGVNGLVSDVSDCSECYRIITGGTEGAPANLAEGKICYECVDAERPSGCCQNYGLSSETEPPNGDPSSECNYGCYTEVECQGECPDGSVAVVSEAELEKVPCCLCGPDLACSDGNEIQTCGSANNDSSFQSRFDNPQCMESGVESEEITFAPWQGGACETPCEACECGILQTPGVERCRDSEFEES